MSHLFTNAPARPFPDGDLVGDLGKACAVEDLVPVDHGIAWEVQHGQAATDSGG
jgi:hypothetical protein